MLKSCVVCGRIFPGGGARCPEHAEKLRRQKNAKRAANRTRRAESHRDDADVRQAMALAVQAAGRCAQCGAPPFGTLKLEAHLPRKYGRVHLPLPGIYTVLCSACHARVTRSE